MRSRHTSTAAADLRGRQLGERQHGLGRVDDHLVRAARGQRDEQLGVRPRAGRPRGGRCGPARVAIAPTGVIALTPPSSRRRGVSAGYRFGTTRTVHPRRVRRARRRGAPRTARAACGPRGPPRTDRARRRSARAAQQRGSPPGRRERSPATIVLVPAERVYADLGHARVTFLFVQRVARGRRVRAWRRSGRRPGGCTGAPARS